MRLLVVEDDPALRESLRDELRERGYAVDAVASGEEGLFLAGSEPYDAIVLDLGLPDLPGLELLRRLRAAGGAAPVLILTARGAWHEKVEGFRAGADDYLTKPFHVEELAARLRALIRRAHGAPPAALRVGRLVLDEERQCARWEEGEEIPLTGTEFRLLRCLMLRPGRVLSASRLIEQVYDFNAEKESNVIEVYIGRLRRKIGREAIETRRGQGYALRPDALR